MLVKRVSNFKSPNSWEKFHLTVNSSMHKEFDVTYQKRVMSCPKPLPTSRQTSFSTIQMTEQNSIWPFREGKLNLDEFVVRVRPVEDRRWGSNCLEFSWGLKFIHSLSCLFVPATFMCHLNRQLWEMIYSVALKSTRMTTYMMHTRIVLAESFIVNYLLIKTLPGPSEFDTISWSTSSLRGNVKPDIARLTPNGAIFVDDDDNKV